MAAAPTEKEAQTEPKLPISAPKQKLPDLSEWKGYTRPKLQDGVDLGTVVGLDYEKWAVLLIDLKSSEGRIAGQRQKAERLGYKKAEGFEVVGFSKPEVWVKPRELYLQALKDKRKDLAAAVRANRLSPHALMRPHVKRATGDGQYVQVDLDE